MPGRPRKPTEDLRLHGTYIPCRHDTRLDESTMRTGLEKPDWFDDDASWHWDLVATAYRQGIIKTVDTVELIQASVWWSEWRKAHRALQTIDPAELPKSYQALLYASDRAAGRWQKAASLLGMSPVDRARIHVDSQPQQKGVASRTRRA